MEKNLNFEEKCQKAIVVKPVNWEQRIGKEKAQRDFAVSMALLNVKLRTMKSTTEKTAKITNTSGWMCELPMTEEQKQEMEQATERMRQRYIAAGMRTSL